MDDAPAPAHLANAAACGLCELYYWPKGNREVDFVLLVGGGGIPLDEFLSRPVTDRLQP